jgi:hypothetical protein
VYLVDYRRKSKGNSSPLWRSDLIQYCAKKYEIDDNMSIPPRVFISYSHDSEDHEEWVLKLATDLRKNGIDAILDQWDLKLGEDAAKFMEDGVTKTDRIIMVCSGNYVERAEAGAGGVGYEKMIVTGELASNLDTKKFIPLIRSNTSNKKTPSFIGSRLYISFENDSKYFDDLETLLREIHETPAVPKPPLGPNPFVTAQPTKAVQAPSSDIGLKAATCSDIANALGSAWDEDWIITNRTYATKKISEIGARASMEVQFALSLPKIDKNQKELLTSARDAQVHTFGWPIGVFFDTPEEFRPKPIKDGISAEIVTHHKESYDYWTIRNNGDFYLLKTIFEDEREPGSIFFNTRIVRTAETLQYCSRLYSGLGVDLDKVVNIRIAYDGLKNRTLTSSTLNRDIFPRKTAENSISSEIAASIKDIQLNIVECVKSLVTPLFTVFDFFELHNDVYEGIISKFIKGHVT